jgi:phosphoserine phosphatase
LAEYVKCTLGLHYCFANNLEVSIDGRTLTGNVLGDIVNGERKAELLATIAQCEGIPIDQVTYC